MDNCSDSDHMEIQADHKIQTETQIPNELILLDNVQKAKTKTEEEVDQKEPNKLKSRVDLQKSADDAYIQDDNTVATSDEELMCDNEIFGDVLTKMKAFIDKSKQEKLEKNIFIDEWQIFNDFFNLMEKYEKNLTDEDLVVVKRGMKLFISAVHNVDPDDMLKTDLDYAKEIFYMYFKLFNNSIIQNYLKNVEMPDNLKILYRPCISRILSVMNDTSAYTDFGLNDLQRPTNCIELLSLMLNYVKADLESSDITLNPEPIDASITRQGILEVLWNYADNTILIPDLIEAGCLEIMIDGLILVCK